VVPEDDGGDDDVSWLRRNAPDKLRDGAGVLLAHVLRGEVNIDQGGLDVAMSHELHQRRQADAVAQHVPGEGMPETVWVSFGQIGGTTVMAE
jgi:hypothetical protein